MLIPRYYASTVPSIRVPFLPSDMEEGDDDIEKLENTDGDGRLVDEVEGGSEHLDELLGYKTLKKTHEEKNVCRTHSPLRPPTHIKRKASPNHKWLNGRFFYKNNCSSVLSLDVLISLQEMERVG